jgi:hypothetical protein
MFISNEEKKYLFDQIKLLATVSEKLEQAESRLCFWETKARCLETKFETLYQIIAPKFKPKKPLTPEQKEKQKGYSKAYYARQKAKKALA